MKFTIEVNAKCRNCKHWEVTTDDDMYFLENDETFCKLDNKKRTDAEDCDKIDVDILTLKDNLKSAGYEKIILGRI